MIHRGNNKKALLYTQRWSLYCTNIDMFGNTFHRGWLEYLKVIFCQISDHRKYLLLSIYVLRYKTIWNTFVLELSEDENDVV